MWSSTAMNEWNRCEINFLPAKIQKQKLFARSRKFIEFPHFKKYLFNYIDDARFHTFMLPVLVEMKVLKEYKKKKKMIIINDEMIKTIYLN